MSQIEEEDIFTAMEEDGTADWIRQTVASSETVVQDAESAAEAPLEETVEADEEVEEEVVPVVEEEPDDSYLELSLSPEAERLLDEKYGGDLNKMLNSLPDAQSAIGRQGNELGQLRSELEQFRLEVQAGLNRPAVEWPDEFSEPEEAVLTYRQIASEASERQDLTTFERAMSAWQEIDPLGSETWATMKYTQMMLAEARASGTPETESLEQGISRLAVEFPNLSKPDFQAEVGKELEKFPTLQRTFQDQTASPSERLSALEEAARLVASRHADGDVRQAVRRVAVKQSEEARVARAEARVAQTSGRGKPTASPDRQIPVGATGKSVGEKELQARIKELSGLDVEVGGSTWRPE